MEEQEAEDQKSENGRYAEGDFDLFPAFPGWIIEDLMCIHLFCYSRRPNHKGNGTRSKNEYESVLTPGIGLLHNFERNGIFCDT